MKTSHEQLASVEHESARERVQRALRDLLGIEVVDTLENQDGSKLLRGNRVFMIADNNQVSQSLVQTVESARQIIRANAEETIKQVKNMRVKEGVLEEGVLFEVIKEASGVLAREDLEKAEQVYQETLRGVFGGEQKVDLTKLVYDRSDSFKKEKGFLEFMAQNPEEGIKKAIEDGYFSSHGNTINGLSWREVIKATNRIARTISYPDAFRFYEAAAAHMHPESPGFTEQDEQVLVEIKMDHAIKHLLRRDEEAARELFAEAESESLTKGYNETKRQELELKAREIRVHRSLVDGDYVTAMESIRYIRNSADKEAPWENAGLDTHLSERVEKKLEKDFDLVSEKGFDEVLRFLRSVPDDTPEYNRYVDKVAVGALVEIGSNKEDESHAKSQEEIKQAFCAKLKDSPDIVAYYMKQFRDALPWTAEETREIFLAAAQIPERGETLAKFKISDFKKPREAFADIPENEKGPITSALFNAYKERPQCFRETIVYSGNVFRPYIEQMSEAERVTFFDKIIEVNPYTVYGDHADAYFLTEEQKARLREKIVSNAHGIDVFSEHWRVGTLFGWDVTQFGIDAIAKNPMKFYDFAYKEKPSYARESHGMRPEWKAAIFDGMFSKYISRTLTKFEFVEVPIDHDFDIDAVYGGAANIVIENSDKQIRGYLNTLLRRITFLTGVEIDDSRLAETFLQKNAGKNFGFTLEMLQSGLPFTDHLPWASAMRRLERVQARSANEDHDPWKTELKPLVEGLVREKVLSLDSAEDAEVVYGFVKEFGMVDAGLLFMAYKDLVQASSKEELSSRTIKLLIPFLGERRYAMFDKPADLLNELRQKKRKLVSGLLADKEVPRELKTDLGQNIFSSTVGSSQWSRHESVGQLVEVWEATVAQETGVERVKDGFQEAEIVVNERLFEKAGESTKEARIKKIIKGRGLNDTLTEFLKVTEVANTSENPMPLLKEVRTELVLSLDEKIGNLDKRLSIVIAGPPHDSLLAAKEKFEKQKDILVTRDFFDEIEGLVRSAHYDASIDEWKVKGEDNVIVDVMQRIVDSGMKGNHANKLLQMLSVLHMRYFGVGTYGRALDRYGEIGLEDNPLDSIKSDLPNFIESFVNEHYLHETQDEDHTGHSPMSQGLVRRLKTVWRLNRGVEEHPFVKAKREIGAIENAGAKMSDKEVPVSLVPARGVLRIMSGDTGDACFTSQHHELASGDYPGITAYTFVTGRNTAHEKFAGSALFIETEEYSDEGGVKTLLVRANNPRENLIQMVDSEALVRQTLEEAIEVAKREGLEKVVVPLDPATASCSNRKLVADFYKKHFTGNKKVQLIDSPDTNFNGYPVWNPLDTHPSVEIWNDQDGKVGGW